MLIDTVRLLLRRWLFVLLACALATLAGVGAWVSTPLQYQSQAQVLFLPPTLQPDVKGGRVNPFLVLGKAVTVTADIIRIDVSDAESRASLVAKGALPDYQVVTSVAQNGGPILIVTAVGDSPVSTQRTMALVVKEISTTLRDVQRAASAPAGFYISATQLTATPAAQPVQQNRVRLAAAAAGGALLLLLALIIVVDRWRGSRRRYRGSSRAQVQPESEATTESAGAAPHSAADSDLDQGRDFDRVSADPAAQDARRVATRRVATRRKR